MRWLLALASIGLALGAAELGLRWLTPPSTARLALLDARFRYPVEHHPRLGYVPRPGDHEQTVWGVRIRVTPDGLRSNGAPSPPGEPILALGDSFTWGDQVGDAETWPAHLERLLGRPVRNGGVFGYGFDQIVLRAEELAPEIRPERIVVSFVVDDIARCQDSYRYAAKPWFEIEAGRLALRGVPVPPTARRDPWAALRWSRLADRLLGPLLGERWWLPARVQEHARGLEVALLLVERLARLGLPVLLVAQWYPDREHEAPRTLLDYAERQGLATLDLEPRLRPILERDRDETWRLFFRMPTGAAFAPGHMTDAGNAWVAERIAEALAPAAPQPASAAGQRRGRPRMRSATMLRWISLVPPAMVMERS